jgi:hypothetical protein
MCVQVQELGLSEAYKKRDDVRHFCGMLNGLAFLPVDEVTEGMEYLRDKVPDADRLDELLTYFDTTYVFWRCPSRCWKVGRAHPTGPSYAAAPPTARLERPLADIVWQ